MGIIVPLQRMAPMGRPIKRGGAWYIHFGPGGQQPRGHPLVHRGSRGMVLLAINQVWVDTGSNLLWVVRNFEKIRKTGDPSYPHTVELVPYYRGRRKKVIAEATLRMGMKVWEDAITFNTESWARMERAAKHDPESPWRGRSDAAEIARTFFGVDRYGNRVD